MTTPEKVYLGLTLLAFGSFVVTLFFAAHAAPRAPGHDDDPPKR